MNTENKFCYDYPRPLVSVDAIILDEQTESKILLIKRKNYPYAEMWALPGGFIEMEETLEESVKREVYEETSLTVYNFNQFRVYGDSGRDPRDRCITIVFFCFVNHSLPIKANDDAKDIKWFNLKELPKLAFDHNKIINDFIALKKNL
jgi:8-oxo-dGTP diphosphatase